MIHHKWKNSSALARPEGDPCTREGCPCRQRSREVNVCGRPGSRIEYSDDDGLSWGPAKQFGGVPACKGTAEVKA